MFYMAEWWEYVAVRGDLPILGHMARYLSHLVLDTLRQSSVGWCVDRLLLPSEPPPVPLGLFAMSSSVPFHPCIPLPSVQSAMHTLSSVEVCAACVPFGMGRMGVIVPFDDGHMVFTLRSGHAIAQGE